MTSKMSHSLHDSDFSQLPTSTMMGCLQSFTSAALTFTIFLFKKIYIAVFVRIIGTMLTVNIVYICLTGWQKKQNSVLFTGRRFQKYLCKRWLTSFSREKARLASDPEVDQDLSDRLGLSSSDTLTNGSRHADVAAAKRLAKRLFNLDGFRKSDVARHLSKKWAVCYSYIQQCLFYFVPHNHQPLESVNDGSIVCI